MPLEDLLGEKSRDPTDEEIVKTISDFLREATAKNPNAPALARFRYAVNGAAIFLNLLD